MALLGWSISSGGYAREPFALASEAIERAAESNPEWAIVFYTEAIKANPKNASAYRARAAAKLRLGQIEGALGDANRSIALSPKLGVAYATRADACMAKQKYDDAIRDCDRALKLQAPEPARIYFCRARSYRKKNDFVHAQADIAQAIKLEPRNAFFWIEQGLLHDELKQWAAAERDFSEAIRVDARNVSAWVNRGYARSCQDHDVEALADYEEALRRDPHYERARYNRVEILKRRGEWERALADVTALLQDKPDRASKLALRGILLAGKGDDAGALAALDEALRADPDHPRSLFLRAEFHSRRGNADAAITDATHCLRFWKPAQDWSDVFLVRAHAYQLKGEFAKALADAGQALRLRPRSVEALNMRGAARFHLGDWQNARADFTQAVTLDPVNVLALTNRAGVETRHGTPAAVIADCTAALELDPASGYLYSLRARAYFRLARWREAADDFTAALNVAPDDPDTHNAYAWMLATAFDDRGRDAGPALEHATRACALTDWNDATMLDTFAAACAEAGRYEEAVRWQLKALELAKPGQFKRPASLSERLACYRENKPYRDPPTQAAHSP